MSFWSDLWRMIKGVGYRETSVLIQTSRLTIQSYYDGRVNGEKIEKALFDAAERLDVILDPIRPRVRVMIVSPETLDRMVPLQKWPGHEVAAHGTFIPPATIFVKWPETEILRHEFGHYLAWEYLQLRGDESRAESERMARIAERGIAHT